MNDDFEHTLRDSLQRHAESGGPASGQLGDVYGRVDRRRARRRWIAVVGSIAVVGAGVIGIAALASSDPVAAPGAAEGIDGDLPTTTFGGSPSAWACTGYLGSDGVNEFYSACIPTAFYDGSTGGCVSTTTSTVPVTSVVDGSTGVVATSPPADCAAGAGSPYSPCVVPTSTVLLQPATAPAGTATAGGHEPARVRLPGRHRPHHGTGCDRHRSSGNVGITGFRRLSGRKRPRRPPCRHPPRTWSTARVRSLRATSSSPAIRCSVSPRSTGSIRRSSPTSTPGRTAWRIRCSSATSSRSHPEHSPPAEARPVSSLDHPRVVAHEGGEDVAS